VLIVLLLLETPRITEIIRAKAMNKESMRRFQELLFQLTNVMTTPAFVSSKSFRDYGVYAYEASSYKDKLN
jgi:hypothetical protein